MKKLIRLIALICVLAFASGLFVSCTERVTINDALKSTSNLQSLDCDLYWKVKITSGTQKEDASIQEKILIKDNEILVTSNKYGSSIKATTYSDGEFVYQKNGEKIGIEDYNSKNVSLDNNIKGLLTTYPKQFFEFARVDNINGKLKLSVSLESVPFRAVLATFLTGVEKELGFEPGEGITVEYRDTSIEILVVEGYVSQVNVKFTAEKKSEDITEEARVSVSLNVNNPGSDVSIIKPFQ